MEKLHKFNLINGGDYINEGERVRESYQSARMMTENNSSSKIIEHF